MKRKANQLLYSQNSKNEQDIFLMGLIECFYIKTNCAKDDSVKNSLHPRILQWRIQKG